PRRSCKRCASRTSSGRASTPSPSRTRPSGRRCKVFRQTRPPAARPRRRPHREPSASAATGGVTSARRRRRAHVLLEKKRLLITGVLTPQPIAFAIAQVCQEQGAEIVLTGFGRGMGLTEKSARRLPSGADVLEMDANDPSHV